METKLTNRGFVRTDFEDLYGSKCSLQKSSLATQDAIWFGVDIDFDGDENTRMHLSQEMVKDLLPSLIAFAEDGELKAAESSGSS